VGTDGVDYFLTSFLGFSDTGFSCVGYFPGEDFTCSADFGT